MRIAVSLAVAATALTWAAGARAQQPIDPYQAGEVAPPTAVPPTPAPTIIPPAPPPVAPVAPPMPVAPVQPMDPYGNAAYPPPATFGYQAPAQGPAVAPSPPAVDRGYYLYSQPGGPPVYYAPPPAQYRPSCSSYCGCACCNGNCMLLRHRSKRTWDGVRRFSIGAHIGFLSLNQSVGEHQVTLGGAGFQLRLRSSGHFGFEVAQSFLGGSYWGNAYQRDAFPFQLSLMFYLLNNRDAHHFNLYALAGVGLVADSVTLYDEGNRRVTQDFTEYELHAGLGAELRFKWFGLEADARYVHLWRDDSSAPAAFYGNIGGAPVLPSSYGVQGNLYLSIWF